jgi:hypothetical protein
MVMSDRREFSEEPERVPADEFASPVHRHIGRSDFVRLGGGTFGMGTLGRLLSACGSSSFRRSTAASGSSTTASSAVAKASTNGKRIAVIEQPFSQFFTGSFRDAMAKYLATTAAPTATTATSPAGWNYTVGNEGKAVLTGIMLLKSARGGQRRRSDPQHRR